MSRAALHSTAPHLPPLPRKLRICAIWANAMLWTFQGWLAMFFMGAGYGKLTAPHSHMTLLLGWPEHVTTDTLYAVGVIELALAATMLAPLLGWAKGRTVLLIGAAGLILIEAAALVVHSLRLELGLALLNLVLLGLTVPVLLMRRRSCQASR